MIRQFCKISFGANIRCIWWNGSIMFARIVERREIICFDINRRGTKNSFFFLFCCCCRSFIKIAESYRTVWFQWSYSEGNERNERDEFEEKIHMRLVCAKSRRTVEHHLQAAAVHHKF